MTWNTDEVKLKGRITVYVPLEIEYEAEIDVEKGKSAVSALRGWSQGRKVKYANIKKLKLVDILPDEHDIETKVQNALTPDEIKYRPQTGFTIISSDIISVK